MGIPGRQVGPAATPNGVEPRKLSKNRAIVALICVLSLSIACASWLTSAGS